MVYYKRRDGGITEIPTDLKNDYADRLTLGKNSTYSTKLDSGDANPLYITVVNNSTVSSSVVEFSVTVSAIEEDDYKLSDTEIAIIFAGGVSGIALCAAVFVWIYLKKRARLNSA
jgi:hypothetical protein